MDTEPDRGTLLAIDPGAAHVGWVEMDIALREVLESQEITPARARELARQPGRNFDAVVVEGVTNYGSAVGKDTFATCILIGRLLEIFSAKGVPVWVIYRPHVRCVVGGSMRARETDIKEAIRTWYGGKVAATGTKKNPGPLYFVRGHAWSALALAVAWSMDRAPRPLCVDVVFPDF